MIECPISFHAHENPKLPAIILDQKSLTYLECEHLVQNLIASFQQMGIQSHSRVAFDPVLSLETPLAIFALLRMQVAICPINSRLPNKKDYAKSLNAHYLEKFPKLSTSKNTSFPTALFLSNIASLLQTSGTSGPPKTAIHSLSNHYYSALGSNQVLPLEPDDAYLLSLPLHHVGGIAILFRCFLAGASISLTDGPHITHLSYVPTQLKRLKKSYPLLKALLLGGGPIPDKLLQDSLKKGLPIYPTYGMTEMSSQIATTLNPKKYPYAEVLPHREVKTNPDGEILVRGKTLFKGYLNEKPVTDWFATGDLGTYSPKKGLLVLGRKDRLFISGGENIQPEEIEKLLLDYPSITSAQVTPIEDPVFGHRPTATITSTKKIKEQELKDYLASILPKYKIPENILTTEIANNA